MSYGQSIRNVKQRYHSVTITSGSTSPGVDLEGGTLVGVLFPGAVIGSNMTLECSTDSVDGTYLPIVDSTNSQITFQPGGGNRQVHLDKNETYGLRFVRAVSSAFQTSAEVVFITRNFD